MRVLSLVLVFSAGVAIAAPDTSKRPVGRPGSTATGQLGVTLDSSGAIKARERDTAAKKAADDGQGLTQSTRPEKRPRRLEKTARQKRRLLAKGAVCGDIDIQGEVVGRVPGRLKGCGVGNAVRVQSVSGVTLSQRSVMDCGTANALKTWLDTSAKPALRRKGGGLKALRVAAHYSCRTRNNKKGAKISEHGKGRAIDISGFRLQDGSTISVLKGWNARKTSKALRAMHKGACGPFGTVLGPNADRFHRDHFHFDTARYRTGAYCR